MELPEFNDSNLLQRALTHRSYTNEHPNVSGHNERLEFLGDAILSFLCAEYIYDDPNNPEAEEGYMTRQRAALVDETQLAIFARKLGLNEDMRLGRGVIKEKGNENPNLLSCAFEALVAAYYLDRRQQYGKEQAITDVREFVIKLFDSVDKNTYKVRSQQNYKNLLQEWSQQQPGRYLPEYVTVQESGPDHAKHFTVEVRINGEFKGIGSASKKKEAEMQAAEDAITKLGIL